jgi:hypothetical protein
LINLPRVPCSKDNHAGNYGAQRNLKQNRLNTPNFKGTPAMTNAAHANEEWTISEFSVAVMASEVASSGTPW